MMRAHQAGISLRLSVAFIIDWRRKRTGRACPVVVRHDVEVFVEGGLGLFPDDIENLVDGGDPCTVWPRGQYTEV